MTVREQQGRRMKHEKGEGEMERHVTRALQNTLSHACARGLQATQGKCVREDVRAPRSVCTEGRRERRKKRRRRSSEGGMEWEGERKEGVSSTGPGSVVRLQLRHPIRSHGRCVIKLELQLGQTGLSFHDNLSRFLLDRF